MAKKQSLASKKQNTSGSLDDTKQFDNPDIIKEDFISDDSHLEDVYEMELSKEDIEQSIEFQNAGLKEGDIVEIPKSMVEDQISTGDSQEQFLAEDNFSQQELLEQIAFYSEQLLINLEGIYIGGVAAQSRDQLYEVLVKYKK